MKWSDKDFCARVKALAASQGRTLTEVLLKADLTEDYLRREPQHGRNVASVLQIAESLHVRAAELMGPEFLPDEHRSMTTMIAHIMTHMHFNGNSANPDDIEKITAAVMAAMQKHADAPTGTKTRSKPAGPAKTNR